MAKILKAIPTTYHGIEFRSKLEAKYAQAFDKLNIVWEYESHGFRFDDGTCYCPDFYMPEIDTYFEVKGVMDDASYHKICLLAKEVFELGTRIVVGYPDGSIELSEDSREWSHIGICENCGKAIFWSDMGDYTCPFCGEYDGNPTTLYGFEDETNLFKMVGW